MKTEKIKTITIIALAVIILVSALFIGISKNNEIQTLKGANLGYTQAIVDIMNQVSTCKAIPLKYQDQTIEIVAINCLKGGN